MEKTAKRIGIAVIAVLLVALLCVGIALALPQAETPLASSDSGSGAELATANVVKVNGVTYDLDTYDGAMDYYKYLTGELGYHGITNQEQLKSWARDGVEGNLATSLQGKAALKPYDDNGNKITYKFGGATTTTSSDGFAGDSNTVDVSNYNKYTETLMVNCKDWGKPEIFRAAFDGCGADVVLYPPMPDETPNTGTSCEMTNDQVNASLGMGSSLTLLTNREKGHNAMFTGAFGVAAIGARLANFNFRYNEEQLCYFANYKDKGSYTGGLFGAMINCTVNNCSLDIPDGATIYGKKRTADPGSIFGWKPNAKSPTMGTLSFGGIAGYSYGTSFTNMNVSVDGTLNMHITGWGTTYTGGVPNGFIGGIVGVSQGVTMHNIYVSGNGGITADPQEPFWGGDYVKFSRVGALVGMDFSSGNINDINNTIKWTGCPTGSSSISGIITSYSGDTKYEVSQVDKGNNNSQWTTKNGSLFGSVATAAVSAVYYTTENAPANICSINEIDPYKITATSDMNSGVTVGFVNNAYPQEARTSDDTPFMDYILGEFNDLDVTYTVPDAAAGDIVWSYSVNNGAEQTLYDKQDKGQTSYTLKHAFKTNTDTTYRFNTGTRVTFEVLGKNDVPLSNEEYAGTGKNVDSKQFDNKRFDVPKLKVVDLKGDPVANNVLHFNNDVSTGTAVWSIWKGNNTNVAGDTAAGAGDYTYRFRTNNTDELFYFINVNGDEVNGYERVIAYKSDNDPDVSRVYSYHIDPKEVEVSVAGSEFTYDTNPQSPDFDWEPVAGDASVPSLNISYKNAEGGALAEAQVTEAGSYTATVSQFASNANYTITNLDALQNVAFTIAPRPLTLAFTADDSRPYNGAPQFPDVTVGHLPENVSENVAVNTYYFKGSDPDQASDDIVASTIVNVGDYMLRVAPANDNYVIDTENVTGTSGSVTETSAWKMFSITKADVEFKGAEDGVYKFTYGTLVRTLNDLNTALGNTGYYFQPVDSNNTVDKDLGGNQTFEVISAPEGAVANMILHAGSYTIKVSYPGNDNLNSDTKEINVTVDKRPLYLNLDKPEKSSYEYGTSPEFVYDENQQATNAVANDRIVFGMVFYRNDGDGEIKPGNKIPDLQGAYPKAVGSYIASFEPISSSSAVDIYNNYYIDESSDNTFAYEITPATLTVTFNGDLSEIPYDGEEHSPATISNVEGIIPEEQGDYNKDTLKVFYVNETGDSASSARNAGTYTLAVAPEAGSEQFMTNYKIGEEKTFTIKKVELTVKVGEVAADYAAINSGSFVLTEGAYIVEQGTVYDTDIFDLVILGKVNGDQITQTDAVDSVGQYVYTLKLKEDGNALNYNLVSVHGTDGATPVTESNGGTLTVEGTEVRLMLSVTAPDGSVSSLKADEDGNFVVDSDNAYAYAAGDYTVTTMLIRTTSGYEGLAFNVPTIDVGTVSLDDQGMPKLVAKNAGSYQFTISLTDDAATMYKFVGTNPSSITVTFVIDKRAVTVTPNAVEQTYGDEFKDAGYSVADDDGTIAAMLVTDGFAPSITSTTTDTTNVGPYDQTIDLTYTFATGNAANYDITVNKGTVNVVPRPVTVSLEMSSNTVTYGEDLPTVTVVSGENFVSDDDATAMAALIGDQLVYDRNAGVDKVPTLKTSAIGNYIVTLAEGTGKITITAKEITGVSVAAGTMPYGGSEANIVPAEDGVFFTENPGFLADDLDKLGLAFSYVGQGELSELEPGEHADALQLTITDEVMKGNYNISGYDAKGTLTVEAMIINEANVVVTLDEDTYDGSEIGYTIQISGVRVEAGEHLTISLTKDGSAVTEIKDAGKYVFAIEGDDTFYQGNVNITVTVKQADISGMDFGLDKTSATYTGSEIQVSANTTVKVALAITKDGVEAKLVNAGTYTVTVTPTDPNYTGSKEFTFTIERAPHATPVIDELTIEAAWDSVTVTHDEFIVQLSKDGSTGWVDTTMEGYEANSSYTLHVRFKEDDNHSVGGSTMISGKTAERTAVEFEITDVEEHYNRAVLTITFEEAFSGTVKFSIDGGKTWKDLTVQDGKYVASELAESTEYTLQVKIPGGGDYLESEVKSVTVKTGIDPAKYTETLAMFGETFSAGDLVNYETLKEQFNGLTEADKAGVDADKFETITAARDAFVASVNSDIEDIQNVAAKTAGRAVAAAAAAVTAAAIALFIAKRKFI